MTEFHNESNYDFDDISSEQYRVYDFGDEEIRIDNPQRLAVSDSGHRVFDGDEVSHYIPYGWNHLYWEPAEGEPHFVK